MAWAWLCKAKLNSTGAVAYTCGHIRLLAKNASKSNPVLPRVCDRKVQLLD